jgi:hypothetical protein
LIKRQKSISLLFQGHTVHSIGMLLVQTCGIPGWQLRRG